MTDGVSYRCQDCGAVVDDSPASLSRCMCGGDLEPVDDVDPVESVKITTTPVTEPSPPSDLPAYLTDPVDRQSPDELRALAEYALKRAAWADRDLDTDELDVDDGEELVDVKSDGKEGYVVEKKIPCGKNCSGCPHGPYRYRQWRDGDTVRSEYLGKADA
jgi:hypothetical protein